MNPAYDLSNVSSEKLLEQLTTLLERDHEVCARLIAHIAEVDARRLYLDQACCSMLTYCVERLHMSEATAYKRIEAARTARRYPTIFQHVAKGELTLTAVAMLASKLTDETHVDLLAAARHKSKRQLEHLIASRFPRPDVPMTLRKVPDP